MAIRRLFLLLVVSLALEMTGAAQTTVGTISGHVVDAQGLATPGVTVTVTSPNLQGMRVVSTSQNGDYIATLLPPGTYTVSFELSGFQRQARTINLAPTQVVPLDITMSPAALSEAVEVIGSSAAALAQTAQVATNFKQELIATLPTNRDINASLLLAPAVHPTGPSGNYSVSGSMSYETLYLVNGVNVNENVRGQANTLYIEDAVQETTIATAGISAEYGRFGGGVVNVITKSGGNTFSGSLRNTLLNDNWRSLTPFSGDTKTARVVPTYEYTLGGPILRDHLWFFTAGRMQNQEQSRQTVITKIPYKFTDSSKRYEGKGTYSVKTGHMFQGNYVKVLRDQVNNSANTALSMELKTLNPRSLPQDLFSINYNGIVSRRFTVEARGSSRRFTFKGDGAPTTDLIEGTQITDRQRGGTYYWSPTFCGVCDPERRDNRELFIKGSYFASLRQLGSHDMALGYDNFNDKRFSNNHQSGSDWVINGTTSIVRNIDIFPQFLGDGSTFINYRPILDSSKGTNLRSAAVFYNDRWRVNDHLTLNLGVRYDWNHGLDSSGQLVSKDRGLSPRLGGVWDPRGDGTWSLTASFAKYVAGLANSSNVADAGSGAGRPALFQWVYRGAPINPNLDDPSPVTPDVALRQLFSWFNANGGQSMTLNSVTYPGVSTRIFRSLASPNALEYAGGVNRRLGARGAMRIDYVYRDYRDFYANRTDQTTGKVSSPAGQTFDLTVVENSNAVTRKYKGLSGQVSYRVASGLEVGGNYTLSHAYGSFEGETVGAGPIGSSVLRYPEYKDPKWNNTPGDLSVDQRHRARLWAHYDLRWVSGLSLGLLEDLGSGVPYNAVGSIDARPFVANPGYITPQGGSTVDYYFSARDAFRTESYSRTDLALNYNRALPRTRRGTELFGQVQVLNVFNQFQLCGCGGSVFANGGNITQTTIDQSVLTNSNTATRFQAFNPFTTTPVKGANWDYGPIFGTALNRFAYTSPRTVRISMGLRF